MDPQAWAREQAEKACIYGAPGWVGTQGAGGPGAINLRTVQAIGVQQQQQDEGAYEIVAIGYHGYAVEAGPYADEYEAALVVRKLVSLCAGPDGRWPAGYDAQIPPPAVGDGRCLACRARLRYDKLHRIDVHVEHGLRLSGDARVDRRHREGAGITYEEQIDHQRLMLARGMQEDG